MESYDEKGLQVTSLKEEWEIISEDQTGEDNTAHGKPLVSSITVSREGGNQGGDQTSREEAHATVVLHPQSEGRQHVELHAVSVDA